MLRTFLTECRRAVCTPKFLLAVGMTVLVLGLSIWDAISQRLAERALYSGEAVGILLDQSIYGVFAMAIPILSPLIYSGSWLEDHSTGFFKLYLPRTAKASYLHSKWIAVVLSGGCAVSLGMLIVLMVLQLAGLGFSTESAYISIESVIQLVTALFLAAGLWAEIGLLLSLFWNSSAMAYGGPFVLYYLLTILNERYFPNITWLAPNQWLLAEGTGYLIFCLSILFLGLLFRYGAERRLSV